MQSMPIALWVVVVLVALALLFDFMNGFHDAANSIATVVSTGVLRPSTAVAFAAFFNVVWIYLSRRGWETGLRPPPDDLIWSTVPRSRKAPA